MKIKKNIVICLILNLFYISNSYIVLPFKIYKPRDYSNVTKLFNELIDNKLIITLQMGTPPKNIEFYGTMNEYIYYLEEGSCNNIYSPKSSYDIYGSSSFNISKKYSSCLISRLGECYLAKDIIYLYNNIDLKSNIKLNVEFYYGKGKEYKSEKLCGKIGMQIENSPFRFYEYENFINTLKTNKLINSYTWYIHYFGNNDKNNYDGAIIFDILNPTFFSDFPQFQKSDDYNTANAKDIEGVLAWTFPFDKIYYIINETRVEIDILTAGLAFETDLILCPETYYSSIKKNFFDYFLEKKICTLVIERYYYIYCDKNSFINYKNSFPSLILKNIGLNKTYILDHNDLFKDCETYYLFMISKKKYSNNLWALGKVFMEKYKFYFDSKKKIIGYFDTVERMNENKKSSNFFDKIKLYLFIIIGIILGIIIGKKLWKEKSKKLRANELEDNFEYLPNNVEKEKSNINNINKGISNYNEIKSPLYDYENNQ